MTVRKNSSAMGFICLMGVVSLFADMTQEGARGIFGAYLGMMGASAAMVGCISGAGELVGYGLRFVTGIIASRSGKYWFMTVGGYALAVLAIPCLAFVPDGNWMMAACFIILGRVGKAIRQPAKSTLLSCLLYTSERVHFFLMPHPGKDSGKVLPFRSFWISLARS